MTFDAYIKAAAPKSQPLLRKIRAVIRAAVPEATEAMAYGIPTFRLGDKNLVHFGAWQEHIGFYATPSGNVAFRKELSKYKGAKGSVQFPLNEPMPYKLIEAIARFRAQELTPPGVSEFRRQVATLVRLGYPKLAGLSEKAFRAKLAPLEKKAARLPVAPPNYEKGTIPFALVINSARISGEKMMAATTLAGKKGVTILRPHTADDFAVRDDVKLPKTFAYLLVGIDRGKATLNVTPAAALARIRKAKRLPLTLTEGIALLTHFPEALRKNNCFSLLASRVPGNQRVPAIWINAKKQPNLGWCWDNNPHSWLGSASAAKRIS